MRTYVGNALGLVAVLTSWYGVTGTAVPARSVRWLVVGVAGVIALGTVNGLWLLAGRRAVGERSALVHTQIEQFLSALTPAPAQVVSPPAREFAVVTVAGGTLYHRSDCQLVVDKDVVSKDRGVEDVLDGVVVAARTPCGVCAP